MKNAISHIHPDLIADYLRNAPGAGAVRSCWPWPGRSDRHGYGAVRCQDGEGWHYTGAHRVAYLVAYREIAAEHVVDHLCGNRICVNPAHLEAVTNAENLRRAAEARTSCRNGHLRADHAYRTRANVLRCRMCVKAHNAGRRR